MNYTAEDIQTALTRELTDERVATAAAYWLDASPHERWIPDGIILARYARYAMVEIDRLKAERRWISVNERLPDQPGVYIVGNVEKNWSRAAIYNGMEFFELPGFARFKNGYPTYWQPLPEPPGDGERE